MFLSVLYCIEGWWKNVELRFWDGTPTAVKNGGFAGKVTFLMLPGRHAIRTGAGESKTRNMGTRGSLTKTMIESLAVGFGVIFDFETA